MVDESPGRTPTQASGTARIVPEWWWPAAGLVIGVWAMLPHYWSPPLNTSDRAEFADHVVPGLVLIAVSIVALVVQSRAQGPSGPAERQARGPSPFMFVAGLVVVLAGLWMFATHVPLVAQAARDEAPWGATLYHSASALTVLLFGLLWTGFHWNDL